MHIGTTIAKRKCYRCEIVIPKKTKCVEDYEATDFGKKRRTYCKDCALELISQRLQQWIILENRVVAELTQPPNP